MEKKEILYHAKVRLGKGPNSRILFCKSVDWVDDQIVLSFSDQPCPVPSLVCAAFGRALPAATNSRFKYHTFYYDEVPGSREEYDAYRYGSHLIEYLDTYGEDAFHDLVNKILSKKVIAE